MKAIIALVVLFVACALPAQAPETPVVSKVTEQPSSALLEDGAAEGGEGGAATEAAAGAGGSISPEPERFAAVPGACSGWRASACVKSPTSSRYYIAVPTGKRFAEYLGQIPSPGYPIPALCIVTGERACGGYPRDVCNDAGTDYFYCGTTTKHDAEGYWR